MEKSFKNAFICLTVVFSLFCCAEGEYEKLCDSQITPINEEYMYQVNVTDVEFSNIIKYELLSSPEGMDIDVSTGQIQWENPKEKDIATHLIQVKVTDKSASEGLYEYKLNVGYIYPKHGEYSQLYRNFKTQNLNPVTANKIKRKKLNDNDYEEKSIDYKLATYENMNKNLIIENEKHKVDWNKRNWQNKGYDREFTCLYSIKNCNTVIIEDFHVIQTSRDNNQEDGPIASYSLRIEDCEQVIIKNSSFKGPVKNYHVYVEGCKYVFIDNVEISGYDFDGQKGLGAGGIFINNGDCKDKSINTSTNITPKQMYIWSANPYPLEWVVVQNCYFHDFLNRLPDDDNDSINMDGLLIQSASNGIMFNNYFENWQAGDAAADVSHRRPKSDYSNKLFRCERNVFDYCFCFKVVGGHLTKMPDTNSIICANNIFKNTLNYIYNTQVKLYRIHETFYMNDDQEYKNAFFNFWTMNDKSQNHINNCFFATENNHTIHTFANLTGSQDGQAPEIEDFGKLFLTDYNIYCIQNHQKWISYPLINQYMNLSQWRDINKESRDRKSYLLSIHENKDYQATSMYLSSSKTSLPEKSLVTRDFYGRERTESNNDAGAFIKDYYLDEFIQNPDTCYELRQVNKNYAGYVLKIRRESDGAVANVLFDLNGNLSLNSKVDVVSGDSSSTRLGEFVAAKGHDNPDQLSSSDSAKVVVWYDQSYHFNAFQNNPERQPEIIAKGFIHSVNGRPSIKFNGNQNLIIKNWIWPSGNSNYDIFTVAKAEDKENTYGLCGWGAKGKKQANQILYYQDGVIANNNYNHDLQCLGEYFSTDLNLINVRYDSDKGQSLSVNGLLCGENNMSYLLVDKSGGRIGSSRWDTFFFKGFISSLTLYRSCLNEDDRKKITQDMKKYFIIL